MKKRIRTLPSVSGRLDTGPVQFGSDAPGVYLKAEDAFAYATIIERVLTDVADSEALESLRSLERLLQSALTRRDQGLLNGIGVSANGFGS